MSYETVESKLIFKGKVMDVYSDKVVMPKGNTAIREVIVRGSASAIVPVDDYGNIYFVRQYRHSLKDFALEIPAGMVEDDEAPEEAAIRETEEEIGFKCKSLKFVNKTYTSIGICTEVLYLYIAEGLTPGTLNPDPDEYIEVESYPLKEAMEMIYDGRIVDIKTVAGILAYNEYLRNKK